MTIHAVIVIGGLVVALLFLIWLAFRSAEGKGRAEAEKGRLQRIAEQARRANEIDETVARLPDDELDRELRNGRRVFLVKADRDQ